MTTEKTRSTPQTPIAENGPHTRKLKLHKTTLLNLTDRELDDVRGGGADTRTCSVRVRGCTLVG